MCFTRRTNRKRKINPKKNKVYPKEPLPEFTTDEMIRCGGCLVKFSLTEININCAGCNKFFHCKVAGTCRGNKCVSLTNVGRIHRLSWCTNCVPNIPENKAKNSRDENCICKECYEDYICKECYEDY